MKWKEITMATYKLTIKKNQNSFCKRSGGELNEYVNLFCNLELIVHFTVSMMEEDHRIIES